ncbi:uncharacterized protein BCR38DRAFT_491004 [Pseudomassariella vexata]|uniref:Uncharacterized protein n=1 Tax=Pseudomassariella vexata TaxID=1141098 RepID=A0A1Y2D964_9PEZI|nr:uncharacterized protein BCR38DRAFT_491004 [Pseudomassariella vexata]ORY55666.1 hypothetical protein BCR38DRAFT_491004 [Pseudomassariella vexata]
MAYQQAHQQLRDTEAVWDKLKFQANNPFSRVLTIPTAEFQQWSEYTKEFVISKMQTTNEMACFVQDQMGMTAGGRIFAGRTSDLLTAGTAITYMPDKPLPCLVQVSKVSCRNSRLVSTVKQSQGSSLQGPPVSSLGKVTPTPAVRRVGVRSAITKKRGATQAENESLNNQAGSIGVTIIDTSEVQG